jgi:ferredoxin
MHVSVSEKCSGHGRCYALAGSVYEDDEIGFNAAIGTTFEVDPARHEAARLGAINCPEAAITIAE